MSTRRHFLQLAGIGAATSLAVRHGFAGEPASTEQPTKPASKRTIALGLASYTLHKFPLDLSQANPGGLLGAVHEKTRNPSAFCGV